MIDCLSLFLFSFYLFFYGICGFKDPLMDIGEFPKIKMRSLPHNWDNMNNRLSQYAHSNSVQWNNDIQLVLADKSNGCKEQGRCKRKNFVSVFSEYKIDWSTGSVLRQHNLYPGQDKTITCKTTNIYIPGSLPK